MLHRCHSGDGCDLDSVWWCVQYFVNVFLVARYLETMDVCIRRLLVFMSVVVTVWRHLGMFVV